MGVLGGGGWGMGGGGIGGMSEVFERCTGCYGGVGVFAVWLGLCELVWEVVVEFHVDEEVVGSKELLL